MNLIRSILFILIISSCKAQVPVTAIQTNKDANTLLWEVSGNGLSAPSYLFGTFHLLCKEDVHFSNNLKTALGSSKELYLEMDMDDPSVMMSGLMLMQMKDGKKLKDLYSPVEYERISSYFKDSLQMPWGMLQNIKPFFLVAMLYPQMMPCKKLSGVEEELMLLAKESKKEVQGLETMAFQASIFDSIPYDKQAEELLKTIDSLQTFRKYFDTMLTVYKTQRLPEIEKLFNTNEFGIEENQDILLDNRNKNWVQQLKTIMKREAVFVAVGAGHLPGDMGLISLLKKEGYTVRPLQNK